jgi:hypothetical protein
MPKKIFPQELEGTRRRGKPRKGWKEEVERDLQVPGMRRWRGLVTERKKVEGYCSTGQSPQWAVVPMEEDVQFTVSATRFDVTLHYHQGEFVHKFSPMMVHVTSKHVAETVQVRNN